MDCKPGSGKKCKMQIAQNVDSVEELVLVLSQENALDTHKTGISKTSVHRIVKQELQLQCKAAVL